MTASGRKPNLRLYMVVKNSSDAAKGTWIPMGAAWANNDGKGFSLSIDFLPIRMPGKFYSFILREPLPGDNETEPRTDEEPDF